MNANTLPTATFTFDGIQGRVDASGFVFSFDGWSFHKAAITTPGLLTVVEAAQAEAYANSILPANAHPVLKRAIAKNWLRNGCK